jgi:hypothetical protein
MSPQTSTTPLTSPTPTPNTHSHTYGEEAISSSRANTACMTPVTVSEMEGSWELDTWRVGGEGEEAIHGSSASEGTLRHRLAPSTAPPHPPCIVVKSTAC